LDETDLKKFKKSEDFRKAVLEKYEENLDEYFRQVDREYKSNLVDTNGLD
jgi:hypothetical protein